MWSGDGRKEECPITEAFIALPKEKQETILLAAANEFAEHGYAEASTNRIVQAAGIGKGMLFYYFGSKLELYHDLIERMGKIIEEYCEKLLLPQEQVDIIETLWRATRVKMEAYVAHPALFDFLARLYLYPQELQVSEETKRRFGELSARRDQVMGELFARADMSRLRQDISEERLVRYLGWAMDGYSQHIANQVRSAQIKKVSDVDWRPFWEEFDRYMEDLKTLFYQ